MKKIIMLLAAFASLSVFSTVSTSKANYGKIVEVISPVACEGVFGQFSDSLFFTAEGVKTQPELGSNTFVACPIARSALAPSRSDIAVNLYWDSFDPAPTMDCLLFEVAPQAFVLQFLSRTVQLQPGQPVQAYFENVRPSAKNSSFTVECIGPAGVLIQNVEIRKSRGR